MAENIANSPETRGLSPEEIDRLQRQAEHEAKLAQAAEVLDVAQAQTEESANQASKVKGFDNVETWTKQTPAPEANRNIVDLGPNPTEKEKAERFNQFMAEVGKHKGISPHDAIEALGDVQELEDHEKAA